MCVPIEIAASPSNHGKFDNLPYKDWRYPRDGRNQSENNPERIAEINDIKDRGSQQPTKQKISTRRERLAEPPYLCFLPENDGMLEIKATADWKKENPGKMVSYVFVSWFSEHFPHTANNGADGQRLMNIGVDAAQRAKTQAFWLSTCCVTKRGEKNERKKESEAEETVWSMSDIIRGARALALAVSGSTAEDSEKPFVEWGERLWTMPELLLMTGDLPVYVYNERKGQEIALPEMVYRRELWKKVWSDYSFSGELLDHYEGSLTLTPLELVDLALKCLNLTQRKTRKVYLKGDMAYVIAGLLRQRPSIDRTDSAFQAFARLSLANDSNMFLERMLCLLPKDMNEGWWSLSDAWDSSIWDIYPRTQICSIGKDDTVIMDGARGASIRWNSFEPVLTLGRETLSRRLIRYSLRFMPILLLAGLMFVIPVVVVNWVESGLNVQPSLSAPTGPIGYASFIIGITLISVSAAILFSAPVLIHQIYRAKVYDSQPWFFGIEGYADLHDLELLIFGSIEGRLAWSTTGSPLSRHGRNRTSIKMHRSFTEDIEADGLLEKAGMFCGMDPVKTSPDTKKLVEKAKTSTASDLKIFTLIDTYTMTVTLFQAIRPPVAVILAGTEGGMQRALLCSYEWTTGTLYRETVLRMETRVWDRMHTLCRLRIGLKRHDSRPALHNPHDIPKESPPLWKRIAYGIAVRMGL